MATAIIAPIWSAPLARFRDLITGRFVSAAMAAPFLRAYPSVRGAMDVVIRDARGRFVPSRFFGGEVLKHFPSGGGKYAAVERVMPGKPEDFLYRDRDVMHALVHYRVEAGELQEVWVTMPKGMKYDEAIFEERFAKRMIREELGFSPEVFDLPEYEIESVDWTVTAYYAEGDYLGEDVTRFLSW